MGLEKPSIRALQLWQKIFWTFKVKYYDKMVQNFSFVSDYSNGSKHKGKLKWSYFENYF